MRIRCLVLCFALLFTPKQAAAEERLGISADKVMDVLSRTGVISRNDVTKQKSRFGPVLVVGTQSSKCLRGTLVGQHKDLSAITIRLFTVCLDGQAKMKKMMASLGHLLSVLAGKLEQPPNWRKREHPRSSSGLHWFAQFSAEAWAGYYSKTLWLQRRLNGKLFIFVGVPPDFITMTVLPEPQSRSRNGLILHPHPADQQLLNAVRAYERGQYRLGSSLVMSEVETGNADAQAMLGDIYYRGVGVKPNMRTAENWYRRASANGAPGGHFGLGLIWLGKRGVDNPQAFKWFRRAALGGHSLAQVHISRFYVLGVAVAKNPSEGQKWCYVSALMGNSIGQYCVASLAARNATSDEDRLQAYYWYSVLLRQIPPITMQFFGKDLDQLRKKIGESLPPVSRTRAERRSARWRPLTFNEVKARCNNTLCPKELVQRR